MFGYGMMGGTTKAILGVAIAVAVTALASGAAYALYLAESSGAASSEIERLAEYNEETNQNFDILREVHEETLEDQQDVDAELKELQVIGENFKTDVKRLHDEKRNLEGQVEGLEGELEIAGAVIASTTYSCELSGAEWPWESDKSDGFFLPLW